MRIAVYVHLVCVVVALCAASSMAPRRVVAQAAEAGADGDQTLDQAIAAYSDGRLTEARRLFLTAHEREANARTLRGLGVVSFALGDYIEAISYLEASLHHPVRPLTDELRLLVSQLLEQARQHVARVHIEGLSGAYTLQLDARPVTVDAAGGLYLTPGEHVLSAHDGERAVFTTSITFVAGATETVRIESAPNPEVVLEIAAEPAPAIVQAPTSPVATTSRPRRSPLAIVTFALGGATLGSGIALYFTARDRHEDLLLRCQLVCTEAQRDTLYDDERIDPLRRAGFALSAIGLATTVTGIVLFTLRRGDEPGTDVVLLSPDEVSWRHTF